MAKRKSVPKSTEYDYAATGNYDYEQRVGETDLQYYRRLAKTADQRLVRLEALRHDKHYRGVLNYAYQRAIRDIQSYGGKKRFNTKPPTARSLMNEKIADMLRFLKSPTSTKQGVKEVYQNRVNTLNSVYGMNLTWEEFADITESGALDKLKGEFGSDTAFKSIGKVNRNKDQIKAVADDMKKRSEKAKGDLVDLYAIKTDSPLDNSVESILKDPELMEILLEG